MHTKIALVVVSLLLLIAPTFALAASAASMPPALFYSLLPLNKSKAACLQRAGTALATELAGQIMKRAEDVALVNEEFNVAIHCRRTGDKASFVTIVVAHRSSFNEARGVALNLRTGMESGIFE